MLCLTGSATVLWALPQTSPDKHVGASQLAKGRQYGGSVGCTDANSNFTVSAPNLCEHFLHCFAMRIENWSGPISPHPSYCVVWRDLWNKDTIVGLF